MITIPLVLKIQGYNISLVLLGILIFVILFLFTFWILTEKRGKSIDSFDISWISLFFGFIISRIFAVFNNFEFYFQGGGSIINIFDKNFLYVGLFAGILFASFLIFKKTNKEKDLYKYLEKVVISYIVAVIPLLILVLLAGKMQGLIVSGNLALTYEDGVTRMPLNIFRVSYNFLFLLIWSVVGRQAKSKGSWGLIYLLIFGGIEFILRFFSNGYNQKILGLIDLSQLGFLIIALIGVLLLLSYYNLRVFNIQSKPEISQEVIRRKFNERQVVRGNQTNSQKERFSLSYSNIQDNVNNSELNMQEKLRIWWNTFKRRFKR